MFLLISNQQTAAGKGKGLGGVFQRCVETTLDILVGGFNPFEKNEKGFNKNSVQNLCVCVVLNVKFCA